MLECRRLGRAVLYDSGREVVFVSSELDPEGRLFRLVIEHELSHLEAWRVYGPNIAEHGFLWRRLCNRSRPRAACVTDMEVK